jgi:hypothetical protein
MPAGHEEKQWSLKGRKAGALGVHPIPKAVWLMERREVEWRDENISFNRQTATQRTKTGNWGKDT